MRIGLPVPVTLSVAGTAAPGVAWERYAPGPCLLTRVCH